MGGPSSFDDPFARRGSPASQGFGAGRDRFKEKAAKGGGKPKAGFDQPRPAKAKGDAFAGSGRKAASGAGFYNPFEPKPAPPKPAPERAKGFAPSETPAQPLPPVPPPKRFAPALKVVASQPEAEPVIAFAAEETRREEAKREEQKRRKGKSSSLVLITGSAAETASAAETSVDTTVPTGGGTDELVLPPPRTPEPEPKTKSRSGGGGGSGGGSNGGGGQPPRRERMFNQDDVVGAALGVAMLFLLIMFFLRGKDEAPDNRLVGPQYASNGPLVAPPPPPPPKADPFGDTAVDLKPTGPVPEPAPPTEAAVVQAAPPPPPALTIDRPIRAWFCTAKSGITPDTRKAMEAELTRLAKAYEGKQLVVRGYADTRGTTLFNTALSGERARVVADFLRTKGIAVAEYVGVGELDGLDDNQNCSNQRRVDVWIAGGPAEEPSRTCAPPPEAEDLACA